MSSARLNYDTIAREYDRRYEQNEYPGLERSLSEFARGGSQLLEVGCGTGHFVGLVAEQGLPVVGLDLSAQMLARARANRPVLRLARGRAEALPFRAASFDRVCSINAFHHFADGAAFIAEARRVLGASGGVLVAGLDPHIAEQRWWVYDYYERALADDHRRYLASAAIAALLRAHGFVRVESCEAQRICMRYGAREALAEGRLDKGTTSQLAVLSDAEYQAGIERVRRDIAAAEARGEALMLEADLRLCATVGWLA